MVTVRRLEVGSRRHIRYGTDWRATVSAWGQLYPDIACLRPPRLALTDKGRRHQLEITVACVSKYKYIIVRRKKQLS